MILSREITFVNIIVRLVFSVSAIFISVGIYFTNIFDFDYTIMYSEHILF